MGSYLCLGLATFVLCSLSSAAIAGDVPLYQPAPDWVEKVDVDAVLAGNESVNDALISYDRQHKLENGLSWTYSDIILRGGSPEGLAQIGKVEGAWHPDSGDFIVHAVEIIRDGEVINVLANDKRFEILRREAGLERFEVNGLLTALLQIDGLQIGDMVRVTSSVTLSITELDGRTQLMESLLADPIQLQFGRVRLLWPKSEELRWQLSGKDIVQSRETRGRYNVVTVEMPLAKQPDMAENAPLRFGNITLLEATGFADWESVSRTASGLYRANGLISEGGGLAAEADLIAATYSDPKERAAAALKLVQDKIRYLFNGLGNGNYTPQSPEETWRLRYGDCKAKALLLLALLDRLGIEAEPALVHTTFADTLDQRLPSFAVFDHIIVRATIDGDTFWLDGTRSGQRLVDIGDTPNFRFALPVRPGGTKLETLALKPMARPIEDVHFDINASAGISFPAPYEITIETRGDAVQQIKLIKTGVSEDQFDEILTSFVQQYTGEQASVVSKRARFDDATGSMTVSAKGLMTMGWLGSRGERRYEIDSFLANTNFELNRSKPEWRAIPFLTGSPEYHARSYSIILPNGEERFTLEGDAHVQTVITGYEHSRNANLEGQNLEFDEYWRTVQWEVPAEELAKDRARLAKAKTQKLQIKVSKDYPQRWQETKQALDNGTLEPIIAMYQAAIDADPQDALHYLNLARFYGGIYQHEKAAVQVAKAIEFDPDADSYAWQASLLQHSDPKAAIAAANMALELDPISSVATSVLYEIFALNGDSNKALATIASAEEYGVDQDYVALARSNAFSLLGRHDDAIEILDTKIAAQPNNPDYLNGLCWAKGLGNQLLESALKECTKAIQLAESPSEILDSRALIFFRMGQFEDALADLNAALNLSPNVAGSLYLRGLVHNKMGNADAGKADLSAAQWIFPAIVKRYEKFGLGLQ